MIVSRGAIRPLPVVLPALPNELLSSWLRRHADFYRVSGRIMLRHCLPDASSLRELDLSLTDCDQNRLGEMLRCDPLAIRNMTHLPKGTSRGSDRDGKTDADLQALREASPSSGNHPWRPLAQLDGGLASVVPSVWSALGGCASPGLADQSRCR